LIGHSKISSFLIFGSLLSPSIRLFYLPELTLVYSCRHLEVCLSGSVCISASLYSSSLPRSGSPAVEHFAARNFLFPH
jgi:hypothetical protein